ncbi:hypothetical protein P280DRAFT_449634 [Massarina eburnea CBS 473.64]|uniref:Mis12-domain-containing protein n=1 Tax=Massarina eburnea CBS 473.64 TaxID=1395130 RepID=A0A6A6S7J3_9PLEO|nr:hypothetical protein P280DRAFT_449634 [Massarina eburnea CBS 473.64]
MANPKQQESMLLTEHFSWPPISLLDDIINAINEVLYRCTDTFETGLLSADPSLLGFADSYAASSRTPDKDDDGNPVYPDAKLEIEEGIMKLETLMENAVDKNFDRLEIWTLRNVLCLPREGKDGEGGGSIAEWIRLGGYENLQIPAKDNTLTPEALHALRRKLVETQKLHSALLAEKTRNAAQIARLRALLQPQAPTAAGAANRASTDPDESTPSTPAPPFAFLTHTQASKDLGIQSLPLSSASKTATTAASRNPLTTHTTFTTAQLPYLRQLLASLKPHLAATALPELLQGGAKEEWARERRVYVESQSKRALERRGVDTRDGVEGVVEGERIVSDEVRGLEGIVEAFAKERGNGGGKENVGRDGGGGQRVGGEAEDAGVDEMDTS